MSRQEGRLIANLGDRDPFSYGGYLIFQKGKSYTGVYWDSPDSDDEPTSVYRFDIPKNVFKYHSWASVEKIQSFVGDDTSEEMGSSKDVVLRAQIMNDIGSYYGFDNLDSYPSEMTVRELKRAYGRVVDGLYKRQSR